MADYDIEARADVVEALRPVSQGGVGQEVVLKVISAGARNPRSLTRSSSPPAEHHGSGVQRAYKANEIDGAAVKAGDIRFTLSPLDLDGAPLPTPQPGQLLEVGGKDWSIENVETVAPAGNNIVFKLQLRRTPLQA